MANEDLTLIRSPELELLTQKREEAAAQFKQYLNQLPLTPGPEDLARLNELIAFFEGQLTEPLPPISEKFDAHDLAELRKSEFLVFQLDLLFLLYFIDHKNELLDTEAVQKYAQKLAHLQRLSFSLTAQSVSDAETDGLGAASN